VQIEGPNGWAKNLPTWRVQPSWLKPLLGARPLTGYHLALNILLILFLHLPQVMSGWSFAREILILMLFFYLTATWDYLWFILNPHYGLQRHRAGEVWWFRHWFAGFPLDYYYAVVVGFGIRLIPFFIGREAFSYGVMRAAVPLVVMIVLSALITTVHVLMRSKRNSEVKVEPVLVKEEPKQYRHNHTH
jgi:hypothetical protein